MIFDISHRTTFTYARSVSISHHLLHLSPRNSPYQACRRHFVMVEPPPTLMKDALDYFGNITTYLTIEDAHRELSITARSNVEVTAPPLHDPAATSAWDAIAGVLNGSTERAHLDVLQFLFDSPFTRSGDAVAAYAAGSFPPGRPVLEAAIDLMNRIHADFAYEGGVTDIYTPVDVVFAHRRGVCQDFAHLFISALRRLRVPARYVSGYLMTRPPEGQPRLVGADASHAWLSIWMPELGWVDLDPTNNVLPADQHITVAWGRDYGDVSPVNGMVMGGGAQELAVAVDVAPVGA
jgi:transglutaminase-like putative cysteine protease